MTEGGAGGLPISEVGSSGTSSRLRAQFCQMALVTRWSVLWQTLWILSPEVISNGLFPLWTPVCPGPLAGESSGLGSAWRALLARNVLRLFCEMYTRPFGRRLVCHSLQCVCVTLTCHIERGSVWASKAEVTRAYR